MEKKEIRPVNLRITEELLNTIRKENESINQSFVDAINRYNVIRRISRVELKGIFTPDEWKFFVDSLNGTMIDDTLCTNTGALIAHCEDSERYEGTATKWNIDLDKLAEKINTLHGANVEALYTRVFEFWDNPKDLGSWSKY